MTVSWRETGTIRRNVSTYIMNWRALKVKESMIPITYGRFQLKCDGTWWRTGWEVKGKHANGVGSQYSTHYLGTWCIQHYYRWCAHLGCQYSTELTPMDSSVSPKDEIWFLRVCHHISNVVFLPDRAHHNETRGSNFYETFGAYIMKYKASYTTIKSSKRNCVSFTDT